MERKFLRKFFRISLRILITLNNSFLFFSLRKYQSSIRDDTPTVYNNCMTIKLSLYNNSSESIRIIDLIIHLIIHFAV